MAIEELDQSIVNTIKTLINREADKRSTPNKVFQDKYESLTYQISLEVSQARSFYENMKSDGLSLGMIEAEGFLRAMVVIEGIVNDINETYNTEE